MIAEVLKFEAYREHKREKSRAWRKANPGRMTVYHRRWRAKKVERAAPRPRPERCEVCDRPDSTALAFDHCHASGAFRGWLCRACNVTLGLVRDDPATLRKLADYLDNHDVKNVA